MNRYDPSDWYWIVAGSTTQVYSSKAIAYVPVADPAYQAWIVTGGIATKIPNEQELWDLLGLAGVDIPATATLSDEANDGQIRQIHAATMHVLFNHENRLRALEAKPPLTPAQFRQAIRQMLS